MPRCHDPRGQVNVLADVLRRIEPRRAGVKPDPDSDRASLQFALRLGNCGDGGRRGGESVEERVALVVDLVAFGERLSHDLPVLRQLVPVAVLAQLP